MIKLPTFPNLIGQNNNVVIPNCEEHWDMQSLFWGATCLATNSTHIKERDIGYWGKIIRLHC